MRISLIRIENLHSHDEEETARLTLPQEATERTKQGKTETNQKKKNIHRYEQKWHFHTCSGTINSRPSTVVCMIVT
jgi:hypothetical protein